MEIKVTEIPREGLFFEIAQERGYLEWGRERFPFLGALKGWLRLQMMGSRLIVRGEIHATLLLPCSRCLKEFPYKVDVEFMDEYLPAEALEGRDEVEISSEEAGISFYEDVVDLENLYMEKVYLSLPMKPLCSDECKGLCPYCGVDLNVESCNCHLREVNSRWEALKRVKEGLLKK